MPLKKIKKILVCNLNFIAEYFNTGTVRAVLHLSKDSNFIIKYYSKLQYVTSNFPFLIFRIDLDFILF